MKLAKPAKPKKPMPYPLFEAACQGFGLPVPTRELVFHDVRKWRFDFAWPEHRIALEVDGGAWNRGRHTRGAGFIKDQEKLNEAQMLGWMVLRCVPRDVRTGAAFALLTRAMAARERANQ